LYFSQLTEDSGKSSAASQPAYQAAATGEVERLTSELALAADRASRYIAKMDSMTSRLERLRKDWRTGKL